MDQKRVVTRSLVNIIRTQLFVVFLVIVVLPNVTFATTDITGRVILVGSGDTCIVLTSKGEQLALSLYGIAAPERGQDYAEQATQFASYLMGHQDVSVEIYSEDQYGRQVGVVWVGEKNINRELVRQGYAWQYSKICKKSFCREWSSLQEKARLSRLGVWAMKNPIPPWKWTH